MPPMARTEAQTYRACRKLAGRTALISGGASGIGRAVAIAFARQGADIAIIYLNEHRDAEDTRQLILREAVRCILIAGDVAREDFCRNAIKRTVGAFKHLDILVNSAAEPHQQSDPQETTRERFDRAFRTHVLGMVQLSEAALPHLSAGGSIINTASATHLRADAHLIDDPARRGAIVAVTQSLAQALAGRRIRVNAVALDPLWTPPLPPDFAADEAAKYAACSPRARAAEPDEIAPCYVFLATEDAACVTGRVLHPNGGKAVA
jgi:NAD(P)-dependent dehydrogenase (short-subunit alcohol dehydrogenase family)